MWVLFLWMGVTSNIVTTRDLVPKEDYFDFPIVSIESNRRKDHFGYGIYIDSWTEKKYQCRVHFKKPTVIKAGTEIVLSGKKDVEKLSSGLIAHKFYVVHPPEIEYICCGVYVDSYKSLLGQSSKLCSREFPNDFR